MNMEKSIYRLSLVCDKDPHEERRRASSSHCSTLAKVLGDYFNKRSSIRNFDVHDQVILLFPDYFFLFSTYERCTGLYETLQHYPPLPY
ncbi:hypothetical protein CEXT_130231 [Caerostris extrusa]|uniref:Uncharacterized protein n=1 Tax=Caerostris extrusa TaxID=172846 RepID=A0AAV4VF97_CAEEX|nr:hypothetical protein CEXT_130231 [Caerostris extrusa]